jgi:hypothetical protein
MKPAAALLILATLAAPTTRAAPTILPSPLKLSIVDAGTGKPLDGVAVAAGEYVHWSGYHSSGTTCLRSHSAVVDGSSPMPTLILPASGPTNPLRSDGESTLEVYVFRAGYCAAHSVISPRNREAAFRLRPSGDPAEHRLRYLQQVAQAAMNVCRDSEASRADAIRSAVAAEAHAIAKTPLERVLAQRVAFPLRQDAKPLNLYAPAVHYASTGDVEQLRTLFVWAKTDPYFKGMFQQGGGYQSISSGNDADLREPFHVDNRDTRGMTALMAAAAAMQPASARLLLEQGADTNVLTGPAGYSALDLVLSRAATDVKESGTEGQQAHLLRMIALLTGAKTPPSLHPAYKNELDHPERWTVTPQRRAFWMEVRGSVAGMKVRAPVTLACPDTPPARLNLGLVTSAGS